MSWTGSENERKPQGICLPPSKPADLRERFTIPAGTPVQLQPISDSRAPYIDYTTKVELQFRKCEDFTKGYGKFREAGWFIFVRWGRVVRRE